MKKILPIGRRLSPIYEEIEKILWEHEATFGTRPEYTIAGFRGAVKIFSSAMCDAAFVKMRHEGKSLEDMEREATDIGNEIMDLISRHTGIDSVELYNDIRNDKQKNS